MAIRRYPFDEMDRFMDQFRRSMFDWPSIDTPRLGGGMTDLNMSLEETTDGYVCYADLPGFEKDEIDLRFHDGILTVSATHEVDTEDDHSMRHQHRSVSEQLMVPGTVNSDEITATYRNGVLEVHLPSDVVDEGVHISID